MLAVQTNQNNNASNAAGNSAINANTPVNAAANNVNANSANTTANTVANTANPTPSPMPPEFASDWVYILILIAIMVAAGAFGGFVNYLLNGKDPLDELKKDEPNPAETKSDAEKAADMAKLERQRLWNRRTDILSGILASFLVPFFLTTSSSSLLEQGQRNPLQLLVFLGFCLIAAMSARTFITSLSSKVIQAVNQVKVTAENADAKADAANTKADDAGTKAEGASAKADDAKGTAESARQVASLAGVVVPENIAKAGGAGAAIETQQSLIDEYNATRQEMSASWTRTDKMTAILRRMIALVGTLQDFDVASYISDTGKDGGKRLMGYAYFFNQPDLSLLPQLVESVIKLEQTQFGQYWGIQAIGKVIAARGTSTIDGAIIKQLQDFNVTLNPATDRSTELKNILKQLTP